MVNDIESMFKDVVDAYRKTYGIELGHMRFYLSNQPVYTNGEPCNEYLPEECGGDWTMNHMIRLNPDMGLVMRHYGIEWHNTNDLTRFTLHIIAHELAHEIWSWDNIATKKFKLGILNKAYMDNYWSGYLGTVKRSKLSEETFCEYLASKIVNEIEVG